MRINDTAIGAGAGCLAAAPISLALSRPHDRGLRTLAADSARGAGCGALYGAIAPPLGLANPLTGVAVGMAVWLVDATGLLPPGGLFGASDGESGRARWRAIAAHVLWGAALGGALLILAGDRAADAYDRDL
ncbi:MAG TPA: hypothetical protein VFC93_07005 [Chloroflexota bacterium]|nr:hypothetical protein [Chloroflexota bacterium]